MAVSLFLYAVKWGESEVRRKNEVKCEKQV